jgi:cyclic dehypoxanthinyl futalosine synthase
MRLNKKEALKLLQKTPLKELGALALERKRELHPKKITTFVVDRNINYTNICFIDCKFCAFKRKVNESEAYILSYDDISQKIDELIAIGGTQILFQGGVHPKLEINYYEDLVKFIHSKYPNITIHGFSAVEIDYISKISKLSYKETLQRLKDAGLSSIPGAGGEILVDRVRDIISPNKLSTNEWLSVHREAHKIGIKSTATMMFGTIESDEDIIEHLDRIRELQDETYGFRAFIMWSFQPENTPLKNDDIVKFKSSPNRYLKLLALARLYLDNFKNIQSSWVTQGSYIGQMALLFGANDLGSTMMEENVVSSAGVSNQMNQSEMIKLISDIDETPAKRDTAYNILEMYK